MGAQVTQWRIGAFLDTSSKEPSGSFPYRHGPQGFVDGHGWVSVAGGNSQPLTFATPDEAQAWIDARVALDARQET